MKKIWQYIQYLCAAGTGAFIGHWPRSWYGPVSRGIARILCLIPQLGKVSRQNLRAAFPEKTEKEIRRIAFLSLANLVQVLCEFFWIRKHPHIHLPDIIEAEPVIDGVLRKLHPEPGRGILFFTPHFGNWEFAGQLLAVGYKFPMSTIVRSPQNPYIGRMLAEGRTVENVELIQSKGAARGIVKSLKAGRCIGLLIDQNVRIREGGAFVNFCGLPVPVTTMPAGLARKSDLDVFVGGCRHEGKGFYFSGNALPKRASEYESDEALTQAIIYEIEKLVRANPEQYLWMYKRFQYIPRDADEDLKKRYPPYATVAKPSFYDQRERSHNKKQKEESK